MRCELIVHIAVLTTCAIPAQLLYTLQSDLPLLLLELVFWQQDMLYGYLKSQPAEHGTTHFQPTTQENQ